MCYDFTRGSHLTQAQVTDTLIGKLIAEKMAKCHSVTLGGDPKPACWTGIKKFHDQAEQFKIQGNSQFYTKDFVLQSLECLKSVTLKSKTSATLKFCHNDLLLGNILYDSERNEVNFIDHEYADYNFAAFDVANHFNEWAGLDVDWSFCPDQNTRKSWIRNYLASSPYFSDEEVDLFYQDVQIMSLASHLYWAIWAVVQSQISKIDFDYAGYAKIKFDRLLEENSVCKIIR